MLDFTPTLKSVAHNHVSPRGMGGISKKPNPSQTMSILLSFMSIQRSVTQDPTPQNFLYTIPFNQLYHCPNLFAQATNAFHLFLSCLPSTNPLNKTKAMQKNSQEHKPLWWCIWLFLGPPLPSSHAQWGAETRVSEVPAKSLVSQRERQISGSPPLPGTRYRSLHTHGGCKKKLQCYASRKISRKQIQEYVGGISGWASPASANKQCFGTLTWTHF